jgi:Holliday junction resolvasome RuvABC ATP-dependent DNA helicase subunit
VEDRSIQKAADQPCESFKKQQTLNDGPTNNLRPPSKRFMGREKIRERLRGFFAASDAARSRRRDYVLYGAGGFGKTQICLKFAEECAGM